MKREQLNQRISSCTLKLVVSIECKKKFSFFHAFVVDAARMEKWTRVLKRQWKVQVEPNEIKINFNQKLFLFGLLKEKVFPAEDENFLRKYYWNEMSTFQESWWNFLVRTETSLIFFPENLCRCEAWRDLKIWIFKSANWQKVSLIPIKNGFSESLFSQFQSFLPKLDTLRGNIFSYRDKLKWKWQKTKNL